MEMEIISVQISLNTNIFCEELREISDLEIFLNASAGHWKRCGGQHVARGPLFGHPWRKQYCVLKLTLNYQRIVDDNHK